MSRKIIQSFPNRSALLSAEVKVKPVTLALPPFHPKQYELVTALETHPGVRFVVGAAGSKFGKLLSVYTPVPTPNGWSTIGELKEGDYVFDVDGAPTVIEYITETQYSLKSYEVRFSDGNTVVVDAGHLWETETHLCRKSLARVKRGEKGQKSTGHKPEVRTTQEIKDTLHYTTRAGSKLNHSIPTCGPVQFNKQTLPLDGWLLGYWLGNGNATGPELNCHESDIEHIKEQCVKAGFEAHETADPQKLYVRKFRRVLRQVGVLGNKHVPAQYLVGDVEQRLALLSGMMDSDGTVSKRGDCMFDNTNKNLADAVEALAVSLGFKVHRRGRYGKLNGVQKKWCYRVFFTPGPETPVFRMKRKLARIRPVAAKAKRRMIVDVREVPSVPMRCLRVESPRHLFLVGKACIPTHNTWGSCSAIVRHAWGNTDTLSWWVAPTFAQSKMAYQMVKRLLPVDTFREYVSDNRLVLLSPEGAERSMIEFKSGDNPDSLRGFGVHFFVMDEAARCPYDSFVSLHTTVMQTNGKGFFISTPKGRGWFYEIYQWGEKLDSDGYPKYGEDEKDPHPEWFSIRMPTWVNPHVKLEAIESLKRTMPEDVFRQEVGAEFLLDSAGVFRGIKDCIKGNLEEPMPRHSYVMGVDLARLKDFSVLTVLDRNSRHLVHFDRFNQISWEVQYQRIIATAKKYHALVVMDSTGIGDPIVQTIQGAGVKVVPYKIGSSAAKQQLIDKLRVGIENERISFPHIPVLKRELESYEYSVSESGTVKYSAPSGQHDDGVISLALSYYAVDKAPFVYKYSNQRGV